MRFYEEAFGFTKAAEPYPGVAILKAGTSEITLLKKRASRTRSSKIIAPRPFNFRSAPLL